MSLSEKIKNGIACDSVGKPDSIIGRAVCLSVHPGKMILFPFLHWFRRHYQGKYKFARVMFSIDLLLIGIVLALSSIAIYTTFFLPQSFTDRITFESTIAPREITTGAPATIVIRYTNKTSEELRQVQLSVLFPKYFVLQSFEPDQGELIEHNRIALDSIPPGGTGSLHIKGSMFGDVGGEQAFQTKMTFVHGKQQDVYGEKMDWHIFQPTKSALQLTLDLPDRIIAYQPIEGVVKYQNTNEIDFPVVSLLPHWPEGFELTHSDATIRDERFEIPTVGAGETGEFRFEGVLKEVLEQITFVFEPSFTFDRDRFRQETLTHTAPVVALPLQLTTRVNEKSLIPGAHVPVFIAYKNTSNSPISNILFAIESKHPFIKNISTLPFDTILPGEESEIELLITLKSSLLPNETSVYENLSVALRGTATYLLDEKVGQEVTSKSPLIEIPISTPIRLESFLRYFTPGGDQLGRGPLPPVPGEETTYWVFWHIGGTTNELTNVRLEGTLSEGVRFTGRQTVSQNGSVSYDQQSQTVLWTSSSVPPTLAPNSKIVGIAFEVGITPSTKLTSAPVLIKNILLTATDNRTGEFVSAQGGSLKALMEE